MSQRDDHPKIQEFIEWVRKNCAPGLIDPASNEKPPFLPSHVLRTYFETNRYNNLVKLLSVVFENEEIPVDADEVARKYSAVFCILLLIGKARYIQLFVQRDGLRDACLPFDLDFPPQGFPTSTSDSDDREFLRRFCDQQWMFCAPVIDYHTARTFEPNRILPIILKEKLAGGGSAILYKIILQTQYNCLSASGDTQQASSDLLANTYVLKTYYGRDAERYYDAEWLAFKRLRNRAPESLIKFYGSFKQDNRYNVILEYADKGSLERYFKTLSPPTNGEDIIRFWEGLFRLIQALQKIHGEHGTTSLNESQPLHGWHQDVKPANILVSSITEKRVVIESPYAWQFKLADLGVSHFKSQVPSGGETLDQDSQGTRTHGAPECCRTDDNLRKSKIEVKPNVDIWSLGTVFSEAAVWLVENYEGLKRYRRDRRAATKQIGGLEDSDCFHDGENMLEIVAEWHKSLEQGRRAYDVITVPVLNMIEHMLMDGESRPGAIYFWKVSQKILREARSKLEEMQRVSTPVTPEKQKPPIRPSESSRSSQSTTSGNSRTYPHGYSPLNEEQTGFLPQPDSRTVRSPDQIPQEETARQYINEGVHRSESQRMKSQYMPDYRQMSHGIPDIINGVSNLNFNPSPAARSDTQYTHHTTYSAPANQSTFYRQQEGDGRSHNATDNIGRGRMVTSLPPPTRQVTFDDEPLQSIHHHETRIPTGRIPRGQYPERGFSQQELPFPPTVSYPSNAIRDQTQDVTHTPRPHPTPTGGWAPPGSDSPPQTSSSVPYLGINYQHANRDIPEEPQFQSEHEWNPVTSPGPTNELAVSRSGESTHSNRAVSTSIEPPPQAPESGGHRLPASSSPPLNPSPATVPQSIPRNPPPARLPVATAMKWREYKKAGKRYEIEGEWLFNELERRDHVFIVDDTLSMSPHWNDMASVFSILAYMVKTCDPDGIDLYFTMSPDKYHNRNSSPLVEIVEKRGCQGSSNISFRLDSILSDYKSKLKDQYGLRTSHSRFAPKKDVRPLNLYIFTDGRWRPKCDPSSAIKNLVDLLVDLKLEATQVGIQFISFGDNKADLRRLEHLDDELGLKFDIVDTTPSNGNVWKMLLGAIDPDFDEGENITFEAPESRPAPSASIGINGRR